MVERKISQSATDGGRDGFGLSGGSLPFARAWVSEFMDEEFMVTDRLPRRQQVGTHNAKLKTSRSCQGIN